MLQNKGMRYRPGVPEGVFFGKSNAFWPEVRLVRQIKVYAIARGSWKAFSSANLMLFWARGAFGAAK